MKKLFKIWLIFIFILAIIASFLVGIESFLFGLMLLPLIIVTAIIIIFGFYKK